MSAGRICSRTFATAFPGETVRAAAQRMQLHGVGSLVVVVYQTQLTREAQYASVRPYLYIQMMANDTGKQTGLLLTNSGIGPALIDEVRVRREGQDFVGDPFDYFMNAVPDAASRAQGTARRTSRGPRWCSTC